jgi:hypothetical protein
VALADGQAGDAPALGRAMCDLREEAVIPAG